MNHFVDSAYDVTSQLFGPDSGIPGWAWVLVVGALLWKLLVPARRTAEQRDMALVTAMAGGGSGKPGKKKKKK